jgi:glycosyltransferase involved in cell wall biosynthesis
LPAGVQALLSFNHTREEAGKVLDSTALFHHLPGGGGIRVASQMLAAMAGSFRWRIHCPEGSPDPGLGTALPLAVYPFPGARRLSGVRRLLAPVTLLARLAGLRSACREAAVRINAEADRALVHNSMVVAAPPVLEHLRVPSVYFCYEYPRHIYEPELIRRTRRAAARALLAPVRRAERRMDLRSASAADRIVTFSSYMADEIARIYRRDAEIVRPGVDTGAFEPGSGEGDGYVLSVGALWPYKGHGLALQALSRIPEGRRPGFLVVADRELPGYGDGLRREAGRLGVDMAIRAGLSDGELAACYRRASVVLCCQAREPYGLVPLEAMACARPVVAVNEGGFSDNVTSGETGLLVPRSADAVADAVSSILGDGKLARRLGEAGREFVALRRTVEGAAARLADIISSTG